MKLNNSPCGSQDLDDLRAFSFPATEGRNQSLLFQVNPALLRSIPVSTFSPVHRIYRVLPRLPPIHPVFLCF